MCAQELLSYTAMKMTLAQIPSQRPDTTEHCFLVSFVNASSQRPLSVQSKLSLATVVLGKVPSATDQTAASQTGYAEKFSGSIFIISEGKDREVSSSPVVFIAQSHFFS